MLENKRGLSVWMATFPIYCLSKIKNDLTIRIHDMFIMSFLCVENAVHFQFRF